MEGDNNKIAIQKYRLYFHVIHNKYLKRKLTGDKAEELLRKLMAWEARFDQLPIHTQAMIFPFIDDE
jgi:hypothetical protein